MDVRSHFRFCDTSLRIRLLSGGQTGHQDTLGTSRCGNASCARRTVEHVDDHADNLSLHLSHTREDIRVDGVGHRELPKGLRLQVEQGFLPVVHGARDVPVLPAGVVHVGEVLQLGSHDVLWETLLGKDEVSGHVLPDELVGHLGEGLADLFLDLAPDAGGAEEVAVGDASDVVVQFENGAQEAAALELPEGLAGPSEDEIDEDDVSDPLFERGREQFISLGSNNGSTH